MDSRAASSGLAPANPVNRSSSARLLLATVALSSMLVPLNSTMVAVALPRLMVEFHVGIASAGWLIAGYLIAMACVQPIAGGLGDSLGRRNLISAGLALFGLASLAATFAPSFALLVLARLGQAASGALVVPNVAALLREALPVSRRGGGFGLVSASFGLGAAAGPPLGGLLTRLGDWRALFALNVPVAACLVVMSLLCLPRSPALSGESGRARFDIFGSLLLLGVLSATAAVLSAGRHSLPALPLIAASTVAAGLFLVLYELRQRRPVIDPRLFTIRTFSAATGAVALSNLAMYCMLLAVPQLLARDGWDSARIGLGLLPLPAGMVLLGPSGGWLADRFGRRWPSLCGLVLFSVGSGGLVRAISASDHGLLIAALAMAGIGLGIAQSGLQSSAVEAVSAGKSGSAAGVYSTGRYLGSIVGSSLVATFLGSAGGYESIALMILGAAIASSLVALALRDWPERTGAQRRDGELVALGYAGEVS